MDENIILFAQVITPYKSCRLGRKILRMKVDENRYIQMQEAHILGCALRNWKDIVPLFIWGIFDEWLY